MTEKLESLAEFRDNLTEKLVTISEQIAEDVEIDDHNLDGEAIRTPKIHSKYISELADASVNLLKLRNSQKQLFLERWKYWMGKQTDKYYAKYGQLHEKVIKSDIDKYLAADKYLVTMSEAIEIQKQIVNMLERTVKDISNRGFHIKNAIDWRRFENGA